MPPPGERCGLAVMAACGNRRRFAGVLGTLPPKAHSYHLGKRHGEIRGLVMHSWRMLRPPSWKLTVSHFDRRGTWHWRGPLAQAFSGTDVRGFLPKARERQAWAHAIVSVSTEVQGNGGMCQEARGVLGGMAPSPWRAAKVEDFLPGKRVDENNAEKAGEIALDRTVFTAFIPCPTGDLSSLSRI